VVGEGVPLRRFSAGRDGVVGPGKLVSVSVNVME
jgi:hypothetical protein